MTTIVITDRMTSVHITELQQNCTDEDYLRCNTDNHTSSSTISFIKNETTNHFASTNSTKTLIKSGLSEKNKNIIFISTISAVTVVIIIIVILSMIFARVYMSNMKFPNEDNDISLSTCSIPPKTDLSDYLISVKHKYLWPTTSYTSFKMHSYEPNWNDIV